MDRDESESLVKITEEVFYLKLIYLYKTKS
jgi:hypothetical protein